jgi:hypothetical protein
MTILCPIACLNRINKLADSNRWAHGQLVYSTGSLLLAGNCADSAFA